MALTPQHQPEVTLEELATQTGYTPRTIRSYVERGLIPPPTGRGTAARYGEEHLVPLLFLRQVRKAVGDELPLGVLQRLLHILPASQVARIARGEEDVTALALPGFGVPLPPPAPEKHRSERIASAAAWAFVHEHGDPAGSIAHSPPAVLYSAPRHAPPPTQDVWTVIDVTPSLRLSMRGSHPETARTLADLAGRLRGWLADADPG